MFQLAFALHIAAGAVALAVFWLPLVTRKGGRVHRRAGWVYVVAAATIAVTAFINCYRLLATGHRIGAFLLYVGVLAAASAQLGVRALRTKDRAAPSRNPIDLAPPLLLVAGGLTLVVVGAIQHIPLYVAFPLIGIATGISQLRFWLRAPTTRGAWLLAHLGGMGVSCITTVTAFIITNASRLGLGTFSLVVWIGPPVLGAIGLSLWRRRYARRIAAGRIP
jgi:uncharacterized membrane protein